MAGDQVCAVRAEVRREARAGVCSLEHQADAIDQVRLGAVSYCPSRGEAAQMRDPCARAHVNIATEKLVTAAGVSGECQISNGMSSRLRCRCVCFSSRLVAEVVLLVVELGCCRNEPALQLSPPSSRHPCPAVCTWAWETCLLTKSSRRNEMQCHSTRKVLLLSRCHDGHSCTGEISVLQAHFQGTAAPE